MNKWQSLVGWTLAVGATAGPLTQATANQANIPQITSQSTASSPVAAVVNAPANTAIAQLPERIREALIAANLPADSVSIVVQPLGKSASQPTNAAMAKPLIDYQGNIPRTPASTQKLIPTFIALDSLGKDFRWRTELWLDGLVVNGTLYGDVIIKGSGDPKLEDDQIAALIGNLRYHGIRQLAGNVIVDNSVFRDVSFDINAFDGKGLRPYNAMPNGMLVNFGTLHVALVPNTQVQQTLTPSLIMAVPAAVKAKLEQQATDKHEAALLAAINQSTALLSANNSAANTNANANANVSASAALPNTANSEVEAASEVNNTQTTNLAINQPFNQYVVKLTPQLGDFNAPTTITATHDSCRGVTEEKLVRVTRDALNFLRVPSANCGTNQQYWLTYPDGDSLALKTVTAHIREQFPDFAGQVILKNTSQVQPSDSVPLAQLGQQLMPPRLLAVHQSAPLGEQITDINHHSNNVMTEQVALSLPVYAAKQAYSTYPATFGFMQQWWQQHIPNHTAPTMTRASGLCRDCRVTPDGLMALLATAYHSPNFDVYRTSLPIAGISGTMKHLKDRDPTNAAIGRGWIKTGTLDNVASMAGYIHAKSGQWYAVVAMVNAPNTMYNVHAKTVLDNTLAWTAEQ